MRRRSVIDPERTHCLETYTMTLDPEDVDRLRARKQQARREGRAMGISAQIRTAIREYLERQG